MAAPQVASSSILCEHLLAVRGHQLSPVSPHNHGAIGNPCHPTGLLREVEARAGRPEYLRLLCECHSLYAQARLALIGPYVQQRINAYGAQQLPLFTRNGCEHLSRVCQLEVQMFEHFFQGQAQPPQQQQGKVGLWNG